MKNREIKFRAWDGKKMHYDVMVGPIVVGSRSMAPVPLKEANLMQYTGLKDKNGKEIYEGDVVKIGKDKVYVEFIDGAYWFCFNEKDRFTYDWIRQQNKNLKVESDTFEIIGNLFENPELPTSNMPRI